MSYYVHPNGKIYRWKSSILDKACALEIQVIALELRSETSQKPLDQFFFDPLASETPQAWISTHPKVREASPRLLDCTFLERRIASFESQRQEIAYKVESNHPKSSEAEFHRDRFDGLFS